MDHDKPDFLSLTVQTALDEIMTKEIKSQSMLWFFVQNGTFT